MCGSGLPMQRARVAVVLLNRSFKKGDALFLVAPISTPTYILISYLRLFCYPV